MKHKVTKIAAAAAVAAIAVGGVCLGAGLAMGGSPSFYYDKNGIHVKEDAQEETAADYVLEYTETGALKKLEIDVYSADVKIVPGEKWAVEYVLDGSRTAPEYSLENQTLKIREGTSGRNGESHYWGWGHFWWYDDRESRPSRCVTVTVPEGSRMEEVVVGSEYGDVTIEKTLKAQSLTLVLESGDVRLEGWEGNALSAEMEYGDLTAGDLDGKSVEISGEYGEVGLGNVQADSVRINMDYGEFSAGDLTAGDLLVENESGSVKLGTLRVETGAFRLEYGDLSATVGSASGLEVDNENGSVTLGLVDGMDPYGFNLHSDWGSIRTLQGDVYADEAEGSSDFIRASENAAEIRVNTEFGDIWVKDVR